MQPRSDAPPRAPNSSAAAPTSCRAAPASFRVVSAPPARRRSSSPRAPASLASGSATLAVGAAQASSGSASLAVGLDRLAARFHPRDRPKRAAAGAPAGDQAPGRRRRHPRVHAAGAPRPRDHDERSREPHHAARPPRAQLRHRLRAVLHPLALWIGALITYFLVRPLTGRPCHETHQSKRPLHALGRFALAIGKTRVDVIIAGRRRGHGYLRGSLPPARHTRYSCTKPSRSPSSTAWGLPTS